MTAKADSPVEIDATSDVDTIITVEGWSRRYAAAAREVLEAEGGAKITDDPLDRGGTTKYGISLRFLAAEGAFDDDGDGQADFDLDMDGDIDGRDVRALTRQDALYLYHRCFWVPLEADSFPAPIGEMMFDQAVNGGKATARKLLQRAINTCLMEAPAGHPPLLKVDGAIGRETRRALQYVLRHPALGLWKLVALYREAAKERYRAIVARFPSQRRFLNGWLARADRLGAGAAA